MPINKKAKLNPELFNEKVKQIPTRNGYGEGLLIAGEKDSNVVVLCADLTESTRAEEFAKKYPERFFEVGVAEQNMATIAAGLGVSGKIPFISSYATFSPGRSWEQIRTTISYNDSNVKIAGHHAGISVGPDGATHQAIEDIATMRVMPNMRVIVPCDAIEARKATLVAAEMIGPVYIRLAREKTPIITTEETPFQIGKAQIVFRPEGHAEVGVIACGALVYQAIMAAKELENEGVNVRVMNLATIKPLDKDAVLKLAKETGRIVTVEEHQIAGGMGSAVAEFLAENLPTKMHFVGVKDQFGQSGTPDELIAHYGMDTESIKEAIRDVRM